VYACDRRGRGASGDTAPYALEREFEDLAAVVDQIGGPVDVVAHSHGALCMLESSRRARNLRRMVLYEPMLRTAEPIYAAAQIDALQALLDRGDRDGVVTMFMRELVRLPPEILSAMKSQPSWKARVDAAHTIVREIKGQESYVFDPKPFADVKAPTLLLLGGASPPFFKPLVEKVAAALPNAKIDVLPGQRHTAMDTAPELFVKEVIGFLAAGG
jgi:pimeloyl-ACP methyl ester carboxylesterase